MSQSITITTTTGAALNTLPLTDGVSATIRVTNLEAVAKSAVLYAMCNDDKEPAAATVSEGTEVVSESWVSARIGAGAWQVLGCPTFGATFADITGDVLTFVLDASASVDIEVKVTVPTGASSSGNINWALQCQAVAS